jgi:pyruvate dehydrogenase E2 component (dihydrolipoamide acetyltransferase)
MIIEVAMPVLGLTMEQGTIVAWLKDVGDRVDEGETLFMVETDKATSDAPAPASGIVARLLAQEGDAVAVGKVIALLAETDADLESLGAGLPPGGPAAENAAAQAAAAENAPGVVEPLFAAGEAALGAGAAALATRTPSGAEPAAEGRPFASPRARAKARELGIDIDRATAATGRLTEKDVLALTAAAPGPAPSLPPAPIPAAASVPGAGGAAAAQRPTAAGPGDGRLKKLSRTRKIIAERMTLSATTMPQVTYSLRCDVTEALALRRSLRAGPGGERTAVSLDALLVRAAALALADFPDVNSQWVEGQGILVLTEVNIAVAVDLEEKGLVIPVVHGADRLHIRETAQELDRLVAGARAGKLGPDDYAGGTFTITSLASLGVETFNPIIVPPQVAILGVGAIVATPVFQQDHVVKKRLLALSLTTDHRILDGGPSARFLRRIRDLLEQPAKLVE